MKRPVERRAHIWEREQNDWYIEPEWCSARLFDVEEFSRVVWDPACGSGRVIRSAIAQGYEAIGSDVVIRWDGAVVHDFFSENALVTPTPNIVSNPPYGIADDFVQKGCKITSKACFLLPLAWVAGKARSMWLSEIGLRRVWVLCPRPSMPPGEMVLSGGPVGGGTKDFAWYVFTPGYSGSAEIKWLRRDED